jgi:quinoprotein glucose dehydrogenase
VRPKGGTFEPIDEEETIRNVLATDVEIGPDGAVWVSDWVEGWNGEGKGRLWRFLPRDRDEPAVTEVRSLLAADWATLPDEQLIDLLDHADRRLRLEAQWELVRRDETATLAAIVGDSGRPTRARVHAAQGLGQRLRSDDADAAAALVAASTDSAWELRQVACRALSDCPSEAGWRSGVRAALARRLADDNFHVVAAAASAIGRLGHAESDDPAVVSALVALAADARAVDRTVRHAVAVGLAGAASRHDLHRLTTHDAEPVRLVTCVALRRRGDAAIASLLDDPSERIVIEAARAIHDLPIAEALPRLATRAATGPADDAFLRRAVSAAEQLGTPESAAVLVRVIGRDDASADARQEAIEAVASWAAPPRVNRVTGVWLPQAAARDPAIARSALEPAVGSLLSSGGSSKAAESLRGAVLAAASKLGIAEVAEVLRDRAMDRGLPAGVRAQAIDAILESGDAAVDQLAEALVADPEPAVRMAARRVRVARHPTAALVPDLVAACGGPTVAERQQAVSLLAGISVPPATAAIEKLVADLRGGTLDPSIALEVREAAGLRLGEQDAAMLPQTHDPADPLADWHDVLVGGDPDRGHRIFRTKAEVSCVRCHQAAGQGGEVGPKLDAIASKRDGRYLLEAIVLPNAKVADGYATTVIITDEGLTLSGIVVAEDETAVTLRDADGKERKIPTEAIDERTSGPSAMPADLAGKLSRRELRDLVAWLQSLR